MFAKRFFFVCAGILCLALAYHFGATSATAQAPGNPVVALISQNATLRYGAVTANGDFYGSLNGDAWIWYGNVFGSATPASQPTWGQVKARYLGEQGAAKTPREGR